MFNPLKALMVKRGLRRTLGVAAAMLAGIAIAGSNCRSGGNSGNGSPGSGALPAVNSPDYTKAVIAFFSGVVAIDAGDNAHSEQKLQDAAKVAGGEPAIWINLALVSIRTSNPAEASKRLDRAEALAPNHPQVEALRGYLDAKQNDHLKALAHFRRASELDPKNVQTRYQHALQTELAGGPTADRDSLNLLTELRKTLPDNVVIALEIARLNAKLGDAAGLRAAVDELSKMMADWPAQPKEMLKQLQAAAAGTDMKAAATRLIILGNVSKPVLSYQLGYEELWNGREEISVATRQMIKLPNPPRVPSPPDTSVTFAESPLDGSSAGTASAADVLYKTFEGPPVTLSVSAGSLKVSSSAPVSTPPALSDGSLFVAQLDWNRDLLNDLAVAGNGLRVYRQEISGAFTDATAVAKVPTDLASSPCTGIWTADVDMDGDLDMIVGRATGPPAVLRGNADRTFSVIAPFAAVQGVRGFAWADFDGDGDPDPILLNGKGALQCFSNERGGRFKPRPAPGGLAEVAAITVGDANNDGALDLLVLKTDGTLTRVSDKSEGAEWETAEIGRWTASAAPITAGSRLLMGDLDNNGSVDIVATSGGVSQVWLSDEKGSFTPLSAPIAASVTAVGDIDGDGRLDLLGLTRDGKAVRLVNHGTKSYHWQVLRPKGMATVTGDQRINSFGVGGEMDVRAGLLVQKQPITSPAVHIGIGEQAAVNTVRILWPNGCVQAEFDLKANQVLPAGQRLKGSCPWLFAWDGSKMSFVTDFIWRSPLGLKINAQDTAGVMATEDWVKIRGDQLAEKEGMYDLRITADLWETHFFDHVSMIVVDHPAGTAIYTDERFAIPPPALKVYPTTPPRPVKRAMDDRGKDVTSVIATRDNQHVDTFGKGDYQGITRDHTLEIDLGDTLPAGGPPVLLCNGWIHPTDSSINVAISQGYHTPPQGLSLEVMDAKGKWTVARKGIGFPEGKRKTILIPLEGVLKPGVPKRVRLRTNLEIFWDCIEVAAMTPSAPMKTQRIDPETADLHYRGFSATKHESPTSSEVPVYEVLKASTPQWRDLEGYYTRFGDVRELLKKVDDRYVIMNAGDEMSFKFRAPAPPPAGWVRDYVLIGDGWVKDGDYNTAFSKTVLPLPTHSDPNYDTPPKSLWDDPVYKKHASDWERYHTRYVSQRAFRNAMRPRATE